MQIRNNQGELIGEINTTFTDKGEKIVTNTLYNRGDPVFQNIRRCRRMALPFSSLALRVEFDSSSYAYLTFLEYERGSKDG